MKREGGGKRDSHDTGTTQKRRIRAYRKQRLHCIAEQREKKKQGEKRGQGIWSARGAPARRHSFTGAPTTRQLRRTHTSASSKYRDTYRHTLWVPLSPASMPIISACTVASPLPATGPLCGTTTRGGKSSSKRQHRWQNKQLHHVAAHPNPHRTQSLRTPKHPPPSIPATPSPARVSSCRTSLQRLPLVRTEHRLGHERQPRRTL